MVASGGSEIREALALRESSEAVEVGEGQKRFFPGTWSPTLEESEDPPHLAPVELDAGRFLAVSASAAFPAWRWSCRKNCLP